MTTARAPAKINLALIAGPRRADGKHEVVTVYERLELADTLALERVASGIAVGGFTDDILVAAALRALMRGTGAAGGWRVTIDKRIPVASGLGGGSSDAATALRLANDALPLPVKRAELHRLAAQLGADVPFFLTSGPQLGQGDGTHLSPLRIPRAYHVVLVRPRSTSKASTKAVYDAFDERLGEAGFEERRAELLARVAAVTTATDLGGLPPNDLASSPLAAALVELGAFRADVSGAGPVVYGLFEDVRTARLAAEKLGSEGDVWVTTPAGTVDP